ncbi:MAG: LD-carboxypeptidase [Bacteroidota bacterium]
MNFKSLPHLNPGNKVAVLSPSFAAPGVFPKVFGLGLNRLRDEFGLEPIEYPTTRKVGATFVERKKDLIDAFENPEIKAIFASIGGNDQAGYVYDIAAEVFTDNPKPFFGYSDNSHLCNALFLAGVPSYYGGSIMTQFAMQQHMDKLTVDGLRWAMSADEASVMQPSGQFNQIGLDWGDESLLNTPRQKEENLGHVWHGTGKAKGILWGGCISSVHQMIEENLPIPAPQTWKELVLLLESSEVMPSAQKVKSMLEKMVEIGLLSSVQAVLVGRPKAWEFDKPLGPKERLAFTKEQHQVFKEVLNRHNPAAVLVQNLDFGHTDPQIPMPYGGTAMIDTGAQTITLQKA